jgi:hypothetical protein
MFQRFTGFPIIAFAACAGVFSPQLAVAATPATQNVVQTYSDLVALAESSPLILRAQVRDAIRVEPARAGNVAAGAARIYVEAHGDAALSGQIPVAPALRYLADVSLDARGKVPQLKKLEVLIFARPSAAGGGELQLVAPDAQWIWDAATEQRIRDILAEIAAPTAPPRITGISMALYQPGTLAGEGETQIFLGTQSGAPASIIVQHKPGEPAHWGVSFTEVVNAAGGAPARDTLAWYRLACALPEMLPAAADVGDTQDAKDQAVADYLLVRRDLGPCGRTRH